MNETQTTQNAARGEGQFKIGDGATHTIWTDSHAGFIIAVSASGKRVKWQRAKATLLNGIQSGEPDALTFTRGGFVGHTEGRQRYSYEPDPNGETATFTLRKNGRWVIAGQKAASPGNSLRPGLHEHYDFNF